MSVSQMGSPSFSTSQWSPWRRWWRTAACSSRTCCADGMNLLPSAKESVRIRYVPNCPVVAIRRDGHARECVEESSRASRGMA